MRQQLQIAVYASATVTVLGNDPQAVGGFRRIEIQLYNLTTISYQAHAMW